jgi:threonine aldolase
VIAMRGFASDNYAGVHPDVMDAVAAANGDHAPAYGEDPVTARLHERLRETFGPGATGFPVFNGTGANVIAMRALLRPWEGVICASTAHVVVDEGGAPERMSGTKLLTLPTEHGKLTPELVATRIDRMDDIHAVRPGMVSVTNSSELGTVYTPDELRALADFAHHHGLLLHVDGARLASAAEALGTSLRAITTDAGVDVFTLGGTKAGLMGAEAVVVLRPELSEGMERIRKQSMQLASKMRFMSAQLEALLTDDLWRRTAGHANAMARRLAEAVAGVPGVELAHPVQANALFPILPPGVTEELQSRWPFYTWDEAAGVSRWMCSWDTTPDDVDAFAADVAATCRAATGVAA